MMRFDNIFQGMPFRWMVYSTFLGIATAIHSSPSVTVDPSLYPSGFSISNSAVEELVSKQAASFLQLNDQAGTLSRYANASTVTTRATASDYMSDIELYSVGFAVATGSGLSGKSFSDLDGNNFNFDNGVPSVGFAIQTSAQIGVNLGAFTRKKISAVDLSKMSVFVSFFDLSIPAVSGSNFRFNSGHFALSAQYLIFDGKKWIPYKVLQWSGLYLGSGLHYTSFDFVLNNGARITATDRTNGYSAYFETSSEIPYVMRTFTIPFEAATNIRLLYLLTIMAGGALDFNFGSAYSNSSINADVILNQAGTDTKVGTISNSQTDSKSPDTIGLRAFLGLQTHFGPVKVYSVINYDTAAAFGVQVGFRFAR